MKNMQGLSVSRDSKTLPHFPLGCDVNTHWFKPECGGNNFHNVGSRWNIIHSKTPISSAMKIFFLKCDLKVYYNEKLSKTKQVKKGGLKM